MSSLVSRAPEAEADVAEFTRLTGPSGSYQSDREIAVEMEELGFKLSHERIRQLRADEWVSMNRVTHRKIRAYNKWKRATSVGGGGWGEVARRAGGDG
jgi:hypothetical protein